MKQFERFLKEKIDHYKSRISEIMDLLDDNDADFEDNLAYDFYEKIIEGLSIALMECQDRLKEQENQIFISWHIDDIKAHLNQRAHGGEEDYFYNPDIISEEDARKVLQFMHENHDANLGITWDTIDYAIAYLKKHREITL